jgi:hypothetical protein
MRWKILAKQFYEEKRTLPEFVKESIETLRGIEIAARFMTVNQTTHQIMVDHKDKNGKAIKVPQTVTHVKAKANLALVAEGLRDIQILLAEASY